MEVWYLTSWEGSIKNRVCPSTHFFLGWNMDMADRASAAILDHDVANTCCEWRSSKSRGIWRFWNPSICLPWTSVMRKRNVVLSCLTYCPGFFCWHTAKANPSNTWWEFIPQWVPEWACWRTLALPTTELSMMGSTPFPAWFFFKLPSDTMSFLYNITQFPVRSSYTE